MFNSLMNAVLPLTDLTEDNVCGDIVVSVMLLRCSSQPVGWWKCDDVGKNLF
ncbi:UNVERIFIED_CONTAM: hypothetical protein FKN15_052424 [Acipenser sinensis]